MLSKLILSFFVLSTLNLWAATLDDRSHLTTEGRAKYARYLYYLVNGVSDGYTIQESPYLEQINSYVGEEGVGGLLYSAGYESCSDIPTSGTASGTVQGRTITVSLGAGSKTIPSSYPSNAGETMDKKVSYRDPSGFIKLDIELKCSAASSVQSGYILVNWPDFSVTMEGFFQMNEDSGAVNVDIHIKTVTGGGQVLYIPMQFKTSFGQTYSVYSGYLSPDSPSYYMVGMTGTKNSNAQIGFLYSYATAGNELSTAPHNYGSLTPDGGGSVTVECVDIATHTSSTGCSNIAAPDNITINGNVIDWTLGSLKNVTLSTISD